MIPLYLSGFKEKIQNNIRPTQGHTYKEFIGGGGGCWPLATDFIQKRFCKGNMPQRHRLIFLSSWFMLQIFLLIVFHNFLLLKQCNS